MKIQVTLEHIKAGEPGNADCCPVALAMADSGFSYPSVYDQTICWDRDGTQVSVSTPDVVKTFMRDFDDVADEHPRISGWHLGMFKQFEFEIDTQRAY